jgi:hypothetical protein
VITDLSGISHDRLGEGLDLDRYLALWPMLYHGTAQENLESIRSSRVLCCPATLAPDLRDARKRPELVRRGEHMIVLRDQIALRQGHVRLTGGLSWRGLIAELNGRVFFWPGDQEITNKYGRSFSAAYNHLGQSAAVLRVDFLELIKANPRIKPYFCRFNSGGPRTSGGRKSPRGPDTFLLIEEWWGPPSKVAEVSFMGKVTLPPSTEVQVRTAAWRPL